MQFDLLATPRRRRTLFAALYLSEGAPIGYFWWALPTRLRERGVAIEELTWLTAVLTLPWTFKFLWAPLVDVVRSARWGFRHWIASAQIVMGLALVPLMRLDLARDFPWVVSLLVVHAVAAATQDVAIDALSIAVVPAGERGRINGWMQFGMLLGRATLGGGGLLLAAHWGDRAVLGLLLAVIWSTLILVVLSREPPCRLEASEIPRRARSFRRTLVQMARHPNVWLGLLFAATAGAAFESVGAVAGPFLLDRGFSQGDVGRFFFLPVIACMSVGALAGGVLSDRLGRKRAVIVTQLILVSAVFALVGIDTSQASLPQWMLPGILSIVYMGVGLLTASAYALFMDMTRGELGGTQFSAFMGATNGCESWVGYMTGRLVAGHSYPFAFTAMAAVSCVSLLLMPFLRLHSLDDSDLAAESRTRRT